MDGDERKEVSKEECDGNADSSPKNEQFIEKRPGDNMMNVPPSPPTFVTMGQLAEAANAFCNMSLVHEITVDSDFKIVKHEPPEESLENCIKKTMHRAFWDLLRSSLESDPPDYEPSLRLLAEVKQSLKGLVLPNQKTLEKLIDNALDLEVARTQLRETGRVCLEAYAEQVINLMKRFCAPVRDSEVEALRHVTDPVDAFQSAFVLLEKMHMDLANFTIAQMRPYIRQQAVTYERSKFAAFLQTQQAVGVDGLAHTRAWIRESYRQLTADRPSNCSAEAHTIADRKAASPSIPLIPGFDRNLESTISSITPTPNNILREAYLALLTWPETKDWPETMIMDRQRIKELGSHLSRIVTLSSLVLVVCNYVTVNAVQIFPDSSRLQPSPDLMREFKHVVCRSARAAFALSDQTEVSGCNSEIPTQIVLTVEHWFNQLAKSECPTETTRSCFAQSTNDNPQAFPQSISEALKLQLVEVLRTTHPVYSVMHKRAVEFLRLALSSHPPEPLPLPAGFSVLCDESANTHSSISSGPITMATGGYLTPNRRTVPNAEDGTSSSPSILDNLSLSHIASRLLPLLAHNRHVFGPWYAEIIQTLLIPGEAAVTNEENLVTESEVNTPDDETTFVMNT